MIKRVRLQNYKNHRDTEVELRPLTVLVGPNGAGKTSFLTGLQMLRGVPSINISQYLPHDQPLESLIHRGGNAIELRVEGMILGDAWTAALAIALHGEGGSQALCNGQVMLGRQTGRLSTRSSSSRTWTTNPPIA